MASSSEQSGEGQRWILRGQLEHGAHTYFIESGGSAIPEGGLIKVMPVSEMQAAAAEVIRESIGSEVVRQVEEECSYWREAASELVEAWNAGELSECGSTFRRLERMLAQGWSPS